VQAGAALVLGERVRVELLGRDAENDAKEESHEELRFGHHLPGASHGPALPLLKYWSANRRFGRQGVHTRAAYCIIQYVPHCILYCVHECD
jgi:hypothetical protein